MTLTSSYQYLGRSSALKSQSGSHSYYLLLYGASSGLLESGNHHVSIKLRLACTSATSFYGYATSGAASAGGQTAFSWSWELNPNGAWQTTPLTEGGISYSAWTDLREGYTLISTGYGIDKTVDLSGSFTFCAGAATWLPEVGKSISVSVSCVLPAIAGASKPSCAASVELGSPLAITITGHSGLSHAIYYRFGALTETIALGVTDSTSWTPPLDLAAQIPNDTSGTATIYCDTYSGSTPIGTEQTTVTLLVPESVKPTVSADYPDGSGAEVIASCLVQNISKLDVAVYAQGDHGSTILSTSVLLDGKAYNGGILTASGEHTLTVTATDSRRRTASADYPITVAPYQAPTLKLTASRCTKDGDPDEAGDHAKITVTGSITALADKNKANLTLYWGSSSESLGNVTSCSKIVEADVNTTMLICATLSDILITTERSMTLSTGYATLDLLAGGKGISFGKAATREGFDCAMPAYFTGGVEGITADMVGAAPAGFGYGEVSAFIYVAGDTNGTQTTAQIESDYASLGDGKSKRITVCDPSSLKSNYAYEGKLYRLSANEGSLELYGGDGIAVKRSKINGDWQPWEWVNPPLNLGVEYRTTKRWYSYPVYKQMVNMKALPNNSYKQVTVSDNAGGGRIIHAAGFENASGQKLPSSCFASDFSKVVELPFSGLNLTMQTNFDGSAFPEALITVEYIKY